MDIVAVPVALLLADKVLKHLRDRGNNSGSEEDVEELKFWLSKFQSFIKDQETNQQDQKHVDKDFVKKIANITADIEDALDEFMFAVPEHVHSNRVTQTFHDVKQSAKIFLRHGKKLSSRKEKIKALIEKQKILDYLHGESSQAGGRTPGAPGRSDPSKHQYVVEDAEVVGFLRRIEFLREQLVNQKKKRMMIQVVGPGGSGKTLLVKHVCEKVKRDFDCHGWMTLSPSFNADADRENWLKDLLGQICSQTDRDIHDQAGNTEQKLRRYLEDKRYLIVLDDVWSQQAYTPIVNLLPNKNTGSRIVITGRKSNAVDNPDCTHKLNGLIEDEALNLLWSRAFRDRQDKNCPQDLKAVSKKIVEKCDGLPLAIARAGSLLSQKRTEREWETFLNNIGSELGSSSNAPIVSRILQPSFVDLPNNIRSCFLYFSIFPEDQAVSRGRLIRSWMAEGFLEENGKMTPEEVAESYLNELIGRSMVRVIESEIDGRVRSCQVLRLHHEFIVPLAKEGNFVTVIDQKSDPPSADAKVRRLSVQCDNFITKLSQISDPKHVRTLFALGKLDDSAESKGQGDDLGKVLRNFMLLKVLDLQDVPLKKLPENVGSFVLLRCVNLRNTQVKKIPKSIKNLALLETLDLKHTQVKELPKWIIKLQKLRHLVVSRRNDSSVHGVKVSSHGFGALSSLQKVSLIQVNNNQEFFKDLAKLVKLRKLSLVDLDEEFGEELCKSIEKMENLFKFDVTAIGGKHLRLDQGERPPKYIQCLHLKGLLRKLPTWISSLSSLVKVVFKSSKLGVGNPLESLEKLPSLLELEMVEYYTGKEMEFKDQTFMSLRKLHVEKFNNLTDVVVQKTALPMLERLTICTCMNLKPLPCSLQKLEELVVYEMSTAFISDIEARINKGELVDHSWIVDVHEPSNSRRIRSHRHVS